MKKEIYLKDIEHFYNSSFFSIFSSEVIKKLVDIIEEEYYMPNDTVI